MTPPAGTNRDRELIKCAASVEYFLNTYGRVYDPDARGWIPFRLWPAQAETLRLLHRERLVVALKARQLGLTWLCLGYAIWGMVFRPISRFLCFSRRETDAGYLVGSERLRGMHGQLPDWMRQAMNAEAANDGTYSLVLANGSTAHAFPCNAGDSYTATFALLDEFDLLTSDEQRRLLNAVKPTIEHGKMAMISRPDKSKPDSPFKRTYREARVGSVGWKPVFLSWQSRPDRTPEWYEREKAETLARTGGLDDLHEQYPASEAEALTPRTQDKRIAPAWLQQCYRERAPERSLPPGAPSIPGVEIYILPQPGRLYVVGADPAEGNPTSDDSALTILDWQTGEECAALAGKFQPSVLADHADTLGRWYAERGQTLVMVERNNHGHAVIQWLAEHSRLTLLNGHDGRPGWLSSQRGKVLLYDAAADAFRNSETVLHSLASFAQLASIEGATLRAPEGQFDDRADSYALALAARLYTRLEPAEEEMDTVFRA